MRFIDYPSIRAKLAAAERDLMAGGVTRLEAAIGRIEAQAVDLAAGLQRMGGAFELHAGRVDAGLAGLPQGEQLGRDLGELADKLRDVPTHRQMMALTAAVVALVAGAVKLLP